MFALLIAISVTIVVLQIISLVSCRKALKQEIATDKAQALKAISAKGEFSCDVPTVEDGILSFKDTTQYLCYEDFLTELTTEDNNPSSINATFDNMGEDEKLAYVENRLGFQSLRAEKLAAFEAKNAKGWATSEEIPDEDWVYSRIRRSMLKPGER